LQLEHFRFQIFIRDEQRLHSIARVTTARSNRLVRIFLKLAGIRLWIGRDAGRHERFRLDGTKPMFSLCSHGVKRAQTPFPPPWPVEKTDSSFTVKDANGIPLAVVHYWDGLGQWTFASKHLTEDEARRIAHAIARLPEFLMQRHGFYPRGGGDRWKSGRPYHVALEDSYIRAHWDEINAL
jgi:hypothetical protein